MYPLSRDLSDRIRGSTIKRNSSGDMGSPWSVPLRTLEDLVDLRTMWGLKYGVCFFIEVGDFKDEIFGDA